MVCGKREKEERGVQVQRACDGEALALARESVT